MTRGKTRRELLQESALAGIGFWVAGRRAFARSRSPNEKLGIAVIGIGGQGEGNLNAVASQAIVALCDVHESRGQVSSIRKRFGKTTFYIDFRRVFDRKDVDAVLIATPDHTHALPTLLALQAGKHVYCEKPLTHSVYEARLVSETAARMKRVTQMGTQIHAGGNYRRVVELIQTGAIGPIREVHVWVDRVWGGHDRPRETPPVPAGLHYNLWLGPARYRPYHPTYLPSEWRGWWDFGGGTLGDMACHYMDLPHWALGLRHPLTVEADGPPVHPESCPTWLVLRYEYPSRKNLPPVRLTWYNGGKRPAHFAQGLLPNWGDGTLFVGAEGMLLADYDRYVLLPEKDFAGFTPPDPFIPDSIGHHAEWIEACKTSGPTTCNFDYSGALTETVLLGNVAYRSGRKLQWDAGNLEITNAPEAMKFINPPYREGWALPLRLTLGVAPGRQSANLLSLPRAI